MRRVILAVAGTVTALVLLLSFKTHSTAAAQATQPTVVRTPSTGASTSNGTSSSGTPGAASTPEPATTTTATPTSTTITGDAVDTRYGPVQVQITVAGGKVTAAQAVEYPQNDGRDQQINAYAVPVLEQETVTAGNAQIDMVSGATYTSDGYLQSLQSALDKAGLT